MNKSTTFMALVLIWLGSQAKVFATAKFDTRIIGELRDGKSNEKIGFANVMVFLAGDSVHVTGTASGVDGSFLIENLPYGTYDLAIYIMGYEKKKIQKIELNTLKPNVNLGRIALIPMVLPFSQVDVTAERSKLQLTLDKKVFTVGKDLANTGSSATDVLNDIPSVTVDIDGNVSLRGSSNVTILVDGKPSGLVGITGTAGLRLLSANLIDRVEVITNPSARYDAEGMSGIINIILKKERQAGVNGSIDLITGYPSNHGAALNLNYRKNKLNFFTNYGFRYQKFPGKGEYYQEFYKGDTTTYLEEDQDTEHGGWSNNIRFGADYFFNEKSILTGSFLYSYGKEDNKNEIEYRDYDFLRQLTGTTFREDNEGELERNLEYALTYKKLFDRKEHELTADFRFEGTSDRETNDIYERKSSTTAEPSVTEGVSTLEKEMRYLFQLDYVYPFNANGKFEAGLKSNLRNVNNDYYVRELGENDQWHEISSLSNNLEYDEMIQAAYLILGNEYKPFSYQIGIRGEYSDIGTHLIETGEKNDRSYFDLFPSIHLTYEIFTQNSLQLSYSRRLRRPGHWELNPFSGYSDSRNIRRGNPNLDPEYTNSYEFNYIKNWEKGSFSSGVYYRHTNGVIQGIRTLEDTIIVVHPENLSTGKSYGLEITSAIDLFKWWNIDGNLNFFKAITDGGNLGSEYKSETYTWFGRINSKTTLWKEIDLQLRFRYMAPRESVQGREKASYFVDLGLSKDILNDKGTLTLSVRDLLNSHKHENETFGDGFYSNSYFQFHRRAITLGFNYRLNREKEEEHERNGDEPNGIEY